MADQADDVFLSPRERGQNREEAMREYLTWEINLVNDMARTTITASASSHEPKLSQALSLDSGKLKAPASPGFFVEFISNFSAAPFAWFCAPDASAALPTC